MTDPNDAGGTPYAIEGGVPLMLPLDGAPGSVKAAHAATRTFLDRALPGRAIGRTMAVDALLVVAELVANACRHAPGPCRLSLRVSRQGIDVAVEDTGPGRLLPGMDGRRPDGAGRVGYGLMIVGRLTRGIRVEPRPHGKVVRACVPWSA
ncbi:ATP-binding protein [Yinghuangia sp. YIM S09857]|uniref:ATP-binding protein n=1 Tax=Yinghuangia sp. YIM S09857 TaxID=3436929 RepID=UPI003F531667